MSIKTKVFAAASALALVGGTGAMAALTSGTANAATPSCGDSCVELFVQQLSTHKNADFLLDVYKRGQNVGQPVILFQASNSDPALDWTISDEGTVAEFYAAGLVSSALALHYGCVPGAPPAGDFPTCSTGSENDNAFEIEYAPYGADTGLCMGTAVTAGNNTPVTLQSCGVSSKTVWVVDSNEEIDKGHYVPLINGSDNNFSEPYVLTYPANGYPTDEPRPQLITDQLQGFSNGSLDENQVWSMNHGEVF